MNDNTPPAGRWKFYFKNGGTQTICSYTVDASGNPSNLDPGIIGSNQTICSGNTPTTLSNTTSASGCPTGSPTYQWQYSTTSSSNGYTNVPSGGTSSTYSPGALTQTTYYIRISTCSDGTSASTEPVTITVVTAGTISASPSTWAGLNSTTQFSSTGTSGGTWTSSNTSVAIIDPSTGVLTTKGSGTTTITYTVLSGCTATKTVTIDANLPVVWGLITLSKVNGNVEIDWSTASEQNTKDFEIQYSTNTINWSSIGTVLAAGNSSYPKNYSFIHTSPLKNNNYNYYRILQRDLDGKFSYSKIVSILFNEPGPDVVVYPNPVEEVLTIYTSTEQVVSLYNAAGSLVWKAKLPAGRNQLPVNKFSKGVYILATNELKTRVIIR